jgi:hypothetical protein
MRKQMTVKVSKKDIRYGRQGNENSCALALALKDKGFSEVQVNGEEINVMKNGMVGIYHTSGPVEMFIENFDDDKSSVSPTTFRLRLAKKCNSRNDDEFARWW